MLRAVFAAQQAAHSSRHDSYKMNLLVGSVLQFRRQRFDMIRERFGTEVPKRPAQDGHAGPSPEAEAPGFGSNENGAQVEANPIAVR